MSDTAKFPYEENAEQVTAQVWKCKGCGQVSLDERAARYCCAIDMACECGKRISKHSVRCDECYSRERQEKWSAKPEVTWDGEFPLAVWDSDSYFFDEDSLLEYVEEREGGWNGLRLTDCRPEQPPSFEIDAFLNDHCGVDWDGFGKDGEEIDSLVNAWIKEHAPKMFMPTGHRLSLESVLKQLNVLRCSQCGHTVEEGKVCEACAIEDDDAERRSEE